MKQLAYVVVGGITATALFLGSRAHGTEPAGFQECGFVSAKWVPGHAPEVVPKRPEGLTAVPEGWTVVNGAMAPHPANTAILVCR